jgi:hypothetical protein
MPLAFIALTSFFPIFFGNIVADFFPIILLTFEVGEVLVGDAIIFRRFIAVISLTQVLIFCIQLDDEPIVHFHIDLLFFQLKVYLATFV